MWSIYTKTGDKGLTSTANNERVQKNSFLINLQGDIDEVNAYVGNLRSILSKNETINSIDSDLKIIQKNLFLIGSEVSFSFKKAYIKEEDIKYLEEKIDFMTSNCKDLNFFIYPSGTLSATTSQVIRSIVRRCERSFVSFLNSIYIEDYPLSYQYINRLSDYFFSLSRYINKLENFSEEPLEI